MRKKSHAKDKWEIKSDDVTVCEKIGHGAFGTVYKGSMKPPSSITHGSSVQQTGKRKSKLTITVAVKMLQGMPQTDHTPITSKINDPLSANAKLARSKNITQITGTGGSRTK